MRWAALAFCGMVAVAQAADWKPEVRLSDGRAAARVTFNFVRSIAADGEGGLHAVWWDERDGASRVHYRRGRGGDWREDVVLSADDARAQHPAVAAAGRRVYVAWHELAGAQPDVVIRVSADGGATFGPPVRPRHSATAAAHPSLAATGDRVHLVFHDEREGRTEIYHERSTDGGRTFEPEQRVSDPGAISWVGTVTATPDRLYVAWVDLKDGNEEEYVRASDDGGRTFRPPVRLTENGACSWAPSLAARGDTVHAVWFDQMDAESDQVRAEARLDEVLRMVGLTPVPAPSGGMVLDDEATAHDRCAVKARRIAEAAPAWAARGGDPASLRAIMQAVQRMGDPEPTLASLAKMDELLVLVGAEPERVTRNEGEAVMRAHSAAQQRRLQARGPTWVMAGGDRARLDVLFEESMRLAGARPYTEKEMKLDEALRLIGATVPPDAVPVRMQYFVEAQSRRVRAKIAALQAAAPGWVARGNDLRRIEEGLRAFQRELERASQDWEIYYRRSGDAGRTWSPTERLTRAPGLSHRPSVVAAGDRVVVAWFDGRDGDGTEIYAKESPDAGATWGADVRLTRARGASQHVSLAADRDDVHAIWFDERDGAPAAYWSVLRGP